MQINFRDRDRVREQWLDAEPYPFVKIDEFLEPTLANQLAAAFPNFEIALESGRTFKTVNERKKIQITDSQLFPEPIAQLNKALSSPDFLADLSYISGIPNLIADEQLVGGGMHITGPGGRLDVHVDFNYMKERGLHRRLNLLLYLNPIWKAQWGGEIQLWDEQVQHCAKAFSPALNRCIIFETSEISFHGVTPVVQAAPYPRHSFATYYYTREPPPNWSGNIHSTIFRARPEERLRKYLSMPAENIKQRIARGANHIKHGIKRLMRPKG